MFGFMVFMLILFLVFGGIIAGVVMLVRASARSGKQHFDVAAQVLAPLIAGTATNQQLHGTYQGMPVAASFVVETSGTDEMRGNVYYFFTSMTAGPGASDWSLNFGGEGLLGSGHKAWHVTSKDAALVARLDGAGAPAAAERSSVHSSFIYRAQDGTLMSRLPAANRKTWPDAAVFANQLAILAALADCNRRANGPALVATNS